MNCLITAAPHLFSRNTSNKKDLIYTEEKIEIWVCYKFYDVIIIASGDINIQLAKDIFDIA